MFSALSLVTSSQLKLPYLPITTGLELNLKCRVGSDCTEVELDGLRDFQLFTDLRPRLLGHLFLGASHKGVSWPTLCLVDRIYKRVNRDSHLWYQLPKATVIFAMGIFPLHEIMVCQKQPSLLIKWNRWYFKVYLLECSVLYYVFREICFKHLVS